MTKPQRTRGRRLLELRKRVFAREPLCRACTAAGRISPAEELDHIVMVSRGGTDDIDNLQPLCKACHADKTARDLGYARHAVGQDGYPLAGHWWND